MLQRTWVAPINYIFQKQPKISLTFFILIILTRSNKEREREKPQIVPNFRLLSVKRENQMNFKL